MNTLIAFCKQITLLLLAGVFSISLITSCQNTSVKSDSEDATEAYDDEEVVEEDVVEELPNESDLDFADALDAFAEDDYAAAVEYINFAVKDLENESKDMDKATKAKIAASITALKKLSTDLQSGKLIDMDKLEAAFVQAEMSVAHDYLIFSNIYAVKQPEKSKSALNAAMMKMENASKRLKGSAKTEAQSILAETKKIMEKGDIKAEQMGNKIYLQVDKMTNWLQKHAKELGINTPPVDLDE